MAMTINKIVTMGGFEVSLKVAGTDPTSPPFGRSSVGASVGVPVGRVGGADKSGATGSVIISGSVGVGLPGIGNDPALSLGIVFYYSKEITVFLGEKIDLKIGR